LTSSKRGKTLLFRCSDQVVAGVSQYKEVCVSITIGL